MSCSTIPVESCCSMSSRSFSPSLSALQRTDLIVDSDSDFAFVSSFHVSTVTTSYSGQTRCTDCLSGEANPLISPLKHSFTESAKDANWWHLRLSFWFEDSQRAS